MQRLVVGQLSQMTVAQKIGSAIPDVTKPQLAITNSERRACRAHAPALRVALPVFKNGAIGTLKRHHQRIRNWLLQRKINLPHDLDGKRARNLSCRMSPHSVGNEEQTAPACGGIVLGWNDEGDRILIRLSDTANIGQHRAGDFNPTGVHGSERHGWAPSSLRVLSR